MGLHPIRGLWAVFLFVVAVAAMLPSRAMAYDCAAPVVDDAGALAAPVVDKAGMSTDGKVWVEAAAQKLENVGAYVRVRTVTNFGGFAGTDEYHADYEANCPTWQDMNGGTKSNLLVLVVSFGETKEQRRAALYYGDLWKKSLDAEWNTVLVDEVVPYLRDGANAVALAAGLDGIGRVVADAKAARSAVPAGPAPVVVVQQSATPAEPMDLSGLWGVMWGLLAIIVVGGGVFAFVSWRRKVAKEREAQQKARLAQQECVTCVTEAEQTLVLAEAKVGGQAKSFSAADIQPLRDILAAARRQITAAQTEYGSLQGADANPDKPGLTEGEYDNLRERYTGLLAKFRAAEEAVSGIDAEVARLVELAAAANAEFDAASGEIESDAARFAAVEDAGFRVSRANATLESAFAALTRAETAKNEKAFDRVSSELAEAKRLAKEAAEQAEAVRRGKSEIDEAVAAQRGETERVDALIDQAGEVFGEISASYAEASWKIVVGNGSQAERLVDEAEAALAAATAAAGMETQDWDGAREKLDAAAGGTQRACGLAEAIVVLKRDLDAAKAAAPGEIEAAGADIVAARSFIAAHDEDIDDDLETKLDDAERSLATAREELAKDEPDYLAVVKIARAVNATADGILDRAQDEHKAMERLRERTVTSMREAERSVDAANRYSENNGVEVDDDAKQLAVSATRSLARARGVPNSGEKGDLEEIVRLADQADQEADRALEMAQADVARCARERDSANREIGLAAADIAAARSFIARNDADIGEGLETRLDEAERALGTARQGLSARKPDYLAVVRAAQAVNAAADAVLAQATDEHEAAERHRQRAASALAEGKRSVEAANDYIRSRGSDVDSDAESLARSAESALGSAQRTSNLDERIRYGQQADQEADRALEMAKEDVRREERRRQEARDAAERQARAVAAAAEAERRRQQAARDAAEASARAAENERRRQQDARAAASRPAPRSGGSVSIPSGGGGRSGGSVAVGGKGGRGGGSVAW